MLSSCSLDSSANAESAWLACLRFSRRRWWAGPLAGRLRPSKTIRSRTPSDVISSAIFWQKRTYAMVGVPSASSIAQA